MSHIIALIKRVPKGLGLLFVNPIIPIAYLRKLCLEMVVFPFFNPHPYFKKDIGNVLLEFDFASLPKEKKYAEFTKRLYFELCFDLYEVEIRQCIKKFLRPGDIFIDVGASMGYFSAIGANAVEKSGQVHCFEPSPIMFSQLRRLPERNPNYTIVMNNCALGENPITLTLDYADFPHIGGTSLATGFMEATNIPSVGKAEVSVIRLDAYLEKNDLMKPQLIKIDVEGYEFPVLKGLSGYFKKNTHRPVIICEIQPTAYPELGCNLSDLARYMKNYGYISYDIFNPKSRIDIVRMARDRKGNGFNVIWKA